MARTDLNPQRVTLAGIAPAFTPANADGHAISNDGRTRLYVKNGSAAAVTVTAVTPRKVDGMDVADLAVSVPAGGERYIGPFPPETFGRVVDVNFSAVASVTVAAFN